METQISNTTSIRRKNSRRRQTLHLNPHKKSLKHRIFNTIPHLVNTVMHHIKCSYKSTINKTGL